MLGAVGLGSNAGPHFCLAAWRASAGPQGQPKPARDSRVLLLEGEEHGRTIDDKERSEIRKEFKEAVNMTPAALEKWLDTDESKDVGWKGEDGKGSGESVGHKSGKRIVELLRTKVDDLSDDDSST